MGNEQNYSINKFAEFNDKELEQNFFENMTKSSVNYARYACLIICFAFAMLIGYSIIFHEEPLLLISVFRIAPFIFSIFVFFRIKHAKKENEVYMLFTINSIIIFLAYLVVIYLVNIQDAFNTSISISMFMFGAFIIPHKWINLAGTITLFLISYMLFVLFLMRDSSTESVTQAFIYLIIQAGFILVASFRIDKGSRVQYAVTQQLTTLSITDSLTGAYNRTKLDNSLHEWITLCKRYDHTFCLIMFDVDNFKVINDNFGHNQGDEVLIEIANAVRQSIRKEDIFARWGGEEFLCLLPYSTLDKSLEIAERLRHVIEKTSTKNISAFTCSFGVTCFRTSDTPQAIIERVDMLMYKSKQTGKNRVSCE